MKKRMFKDKFGLTYMVIQGKKTMTSDILPELGPETELVGTNGKGEFEFRIGGNYETVAIKPKFKVGEVVAIAQNYKDAGYHPGTIQRAMLKIDGVMQKGDFAMSNLPGWRNKMFVRAELMPHLIRIENVKCERLRQISELDILKEGVLRFERCFDDYPYVVERYIYSIPGIDCRYNSALEPFLRIVRDIFGKGTWEKNPYRIAYEFTLIQ